MPMRALIQRVSSASVTVDGQVTGSISRGLLVFVGIHKHDVPGDGEWLAQKILQLRVFEDDAGKMNRSVTDIGGELLVVSQFTLYGDLRKGTRPSYSDAMAGEAARGTAAPAASPAAGPAARPQAARGCTLERGPAQLRGRESCRSPLDEKHAGRSSREHVSKADACVGLQC